MGEIAEQIINGEICEICMMFLEDFDSPGFPRRCKDCEEDEDGEIQKLSD